MNQLEIYKENFCISTDPGKLDLVFVHHFLSTGSYWARHIPSERVEKAAAHSLNFGVYDEGKQVGYARIITDYATVAYLGDVFISEPYRGKGLSKWLMQTIMTHPDLQGLRRWILLTRDAHALYKKFGWKEISSGQRWMEIHHPELYSEGMG